MIELRANLDLATSDNGTTPLGIAAEVGHSDVVDILLNGGAAVGAATTDDQTALHLASAEGQSILIVPHLTRSMMGQLIFSC